MEYSQQGNYTVFAGLLVEILSHYNIFLPQSDAINIVASVIIIVGAMKQWKEHKKLAISAGAYKK